MNLTEPLRSATGFLAALVAAFLLGCPEEPAPDAGPLDAGADPPPALCEEEPDGACASERPWLCAADAPPRYDCDTCGCPDGARCEAGACYAISLLDGQRDLPGVPLDLALDDYFALVDRLTRGNTRYARWLDETQAARATDERLAALVVGQGTGRGREATFAARLAVDLGADAIALPAALDRAGACARAAEETRARAPGEALFALSLPAELAHREVCAHRQHFPTCLVPFAADCVLAEGRLPLSLLVMDLAPLADDLERALLSRAGGFPPGQVDFQLERTIARFSQSLGSLSLNEDFQVDLAGQRPFLRIAAGDEGADIALLYDEGREPALLKGFRVLWDDAPTQAFLIEHDITAKDCEATREDDGSGPRVRFTCVNGAYRVDAVVDAVSFVLLEVTTSAP